MKRSITTCSIGFIVTSACALVVTSRPAAAQTITDSNSSFTFGAISGPTVRPDPMAGAGSDLTVGGTQLTGNSMPQTWWWYRDNTAGSPDTREWALSNRTVSSATGASASLRYLEPLSGPRFQFDVGYVIQDNVDPAARLLQTVLITNIDTVPRDLTVYAFVDVDLNGALGDAGSLIGSDIQIADFPNSVLIQPTVWPGSHVYEVANAIPLRNELGNGGLETFSNAGLPYGGADFSAVLKWTITGLQPNAFTAVGLNVDFNAGTWPCPGDVDLDGWTNLTDLAILLGEFGSTGTGLAADLNGDLAVDIADLAILLSAFGCQS